MRSSMCESNSVTEVTGVNATAWACANDTAPMTVDRARYPGELTDVVCFAWSDGSATLLDALRVIEACHRGCLRGRHRVPDASFAALARGPLGHDIHWVGPERHLEGILVRWPGGGYKIDGEVTASDLVEMLRLHMTEHAPEYPEPPQAGSKDRK